MAEEIDLSPAEEAALERAWAKVGPLLAPGRTDAPFAADGPDLSGLGDLLNLSRQEVLDALFDAAIDSFDLALPDAAFGAPDQPREPAGSPEGGRWASGGGDLPFPPPYKARIADVADSVLAAARRNLARAGADPFRLGKARSDAAEALERAVKNRAGSLLREFREWFGDAEMRGLPEYRRLNEAGKRLASDAWVLGYRLGTGEEPALRAAFAESLLNFSAKVLTLTQAVRAAGFSGAADAPFYSPDQPRVPAGSPGGGRWAGGVSPGTAAARDAAFGAPDQPRLPAGQAGGGEWTSVGGGPPVPPTALARYYHSLLGYIADNGPAPAGELSGHLGDRHRLGAAKARAVVEHLAGQGDLARGTDEYGRAVLDRPGARTPAPHPAPQAAPPAPAPVAPRVTPPPAAGAYVLDFAARAGQYPGGLAPVWELQRQLGLPPDDLKALLFRLSREDKIRLVAVGDRSRLTHEQLRDSVQGENETFAYVEPGPDHPTAALSLDAPFYSPDQPRVPAGRPGGGRWAGGVSPGTAAARDAASDAVRAFAAGQGPPTAAEAEALAGHLAKLTVAQIHDLRREHGLRGSAPSKAALVAKLAERFRAQRERNLPESVSTAVDTGASRGDNTPVGQTTPTGVQAVTATTKGPHEMTATEFHGQPVSRERAVRTTSVYRGVNRDEGTRRTPGVTRTVADARKYLDDVLWPVPKPWHTPPAGAVPAARERYLTPAPMPDVSAAGVRAAADAAIAAHTAGASLMVPERADEPKRPASVLALYPNGSLKRVMPHPDPGSNEMRGQVQEWDAVPEAVVARVRVLAHYHAVEAALAAGKPVRPEVLADYPDLAERYHA